jgi:hypothetical protein
MAELIRIQPDVAAAVHWSLDCGHPGLAARITGNMRLCTHWRPDASVLDLSVEVARHSAIRGSPAAALALAAGGMAACDTGSSAKPTASAPKHWARRRAQTSASSRSSTCLGIATLYWLDHGRSASLWQQIAADTTLPPARWADGYASLALLCFYAGDLAAVAVAEHRPAASPHHRCCQRRPSPERIDERAEGVGSRPRPPQVRPHRAYQCRACQRRQQLQ